MDAASILIVEDEPVWRKDIQRACNASGTGCRPRRPREQAIRKAGRHASRSHSDGYCAERENGRRQKRLFKFSAGGRMCRSST